MKLVTYFNEEVDSRDIEEFELYQIFEQFKNIRVKTKSPYELLRFRNPDVLMIIYQDNRKLRTRNGWIEKRSLAKLVENYPEFAPIKRNVISLLNGVETEVDGVGSDGTLIEVKNTTITDEHLKFYEFKRKHLAPDSDLLLIGKKINKNSSLSYPKVKLIQFQADRSSVFNYYLNDFQFPESVKEVISRRHVRFLLSNGHWRSQKSRYTKTAKWEIEDKLQRDISKLKRSMPIKIYWSLAEMTGPLDEYRGKGYPIDRILAGFDVDGSHTGFHEIIASPICIKCQKNADWKLQQVIEQLDSLGQASNYRIFNSGSKGYHIYLLGPENDYFRIINKDEMKGWVEELLPYIDPFLSKTTSEFDEHRIFKIPHTIDASTGVVVSEHLDRIQFSDKLQFL